MNDEKEKLKWINLKGEICDLPQIPREINFNIVKEAIEKTRKVISKAIKLGKCNDCPEQPILFPMLVGLDKDFYICELESARPTFTDTGMLEIVYRTHKCSGHKRFKNKGRALQNAMRRRKSAWGKVL